MRGDKIGAIQELLSCTYMKAVMVYHDFWNGHVVPEGVEEIVMG